MSPYGFTISQPVDQTHFPSSTHYTSRYFTTLLAQYLHHASKLLQRLDENSEVWYNKNGTDIDIVDADIIDAPNARDY